MGWVLCSSLMVIESVFHVYLSIVVCGDYTGQYSQDGVERSLSGQVMDPFISNGHYRFDQAFTILEGYSH